MMMMMKISCHETVACHGAYFDFWNNLYFTITNIEWQNETSSDNKLFHLATLRHYHLLPPGFLWKEVYFEGRYLRQILKPVTGNFVYKADGTTLRINVWQVYDMVVYIGTTLRLCDIDIQSPFRLTIGKNLKNYRKIGANKKIYFRFIYKFSKKNFNFEKNLGSLPPVMLSRKYVLRRTWISSSKEHIIIFIIIIIIIII